MKSFKVNEFITLKLEDNKTKILVNGEDFIQCKFILLNIPIDDSTYLNEIESIDEASDKLDSKLEKESNPIITPEIEFWVHCSNLEVWSENNYDTKLLHRNIAFPLLKKLYEAGDQQAKRIFKEEIAKRLEKGHRNVICYLTLEKYTNYLTRQELEDSLYSWQKKFENWWDKNVKYDDSYLSLNGCGILKLPKDIGSMQHLKYLELEKNNLITLPEELCDIKSLIGLNVSRNSLKNLPESIGNLTNLKNLEAPLNYITSLPESFRNLTLLKKLNLNYNLLQKIPPFLCNMRNLKNLKLVNNQIAELPKNLGNLVNLKKLDMSFNELETLPSTIGNLKKLEYLNLRNNRINYIPEPFCKLSSLKYIYLENNRLRELPENIGDLNSVEAMNLNKNFIEKPPQSIRKLKSRVFGLNNKKK